MKLTDVAIVFQIFFICLLTVLHVRSEYSHSEVVADIMYNNVMDGIVEDALIAGFEAVDDRDKPIVNLENTLKCYLAEQKLYSSEDRQILLYVDDDGFYLWDSEMSSDWSNMVKFSNGESTEHPCKVLELTEYIENAYGIKLRIPFNNGESWANTVDDYSLLAISINRNYDVSCFSGAKIHPLNAELPVR